MPVKGTIFSAASKIKPVDDPCKLSRCSLLKPHPGLHSFPCKIVQNNSIWASFQYSNIVRVGQIDSTCNVTFSRACKVSKTSVLSCFTCALFLLADYAPSCCHCRQRGRSVADFNCQFETYCFHFTMYSRAICPLRLNACLSKETARTHGAPPESPC